MTEQKKREQLRAVLDKAHALRNPETYIRAGWDIGNIAEKLRITEDEVRSAIEECRKKGIRLADTLLNALIRLDYTVPELSQEIGWTEEEIQTYMERGANLKAAREAAEVTKEMLAKRLGVPLREFTRLEAGNYGDEPLLEQVEAILRDVRKCNGQKSLP